MPRTLIRQHGTISLVRSKLGLSQQQLADTLGISRSAVAMIETGRRKYSGKAALIYKDLSDKALAINPDGFVAIRRGRKPSGAGVEVVTNYNRNIKAGKINAVEWLEKETEKLRYRQNGLRLKRLKMEERYRKFSDRLQYASAMVNSSAGMMQMVAEEKERDRHELNHAVFYAREVKLKQQLKKCGHVEMLKLERRMGLLEAKISVMETYKDAFKDETHRESGSGQERYSCRKK